MSCVKTLKYYTLNFIFYLVSITLILCVPTHMCVCCNSFRKFKNYESHLHLFMPFSVSHICLYRCKFDSGIICVWPENFLISWMQLYHFLFPFPPSNLFDITPILFQIHSLCSFNCCTCMHSCMFVCMYVCIYILKYIHETCSVHMNCLHTISELTT